MFIKVFKIGAIILLIFTVFHPERHAKYYNFIPKYDTLNELVEISEDRQSNLKPCIYNNILSNSREIWSNDIYKIHNYTPPYKGK